MFRYWFYCHEWKLNHLIVDDAYPAVLEEVANVLRPLEDEHVIVKDFYKRNINFD